jgi:hypothetical protein
VALAARVRWRGHVQATIADLQIGIRSDYIHTIGREPHAVLDLNDRHRRAGAQDAGQFAFALRIEMQHDNEGRAAVGRHRVEETAQSFDAAGRRADADNRHSCGFGFDNAAGGQGPSTSTRIIVRQGFRLGLSLGVISSSS